MAAIIGVVVDDWKDAKTTIRVSKLPAPGQLLELRDGTCVVVTSVHPMTQPTLIQAVVCAELASG